MKVHFWAIIFGTLLLASCDKTTEPTVTPSVSLNFKGKYNGAELVMGKPFVFNDTLDLTFFNNTFFLTNIRLVGSDNQEVVLKDVELISLSKENLADAQKGTTVAYKSVPTGTYKAIKFNLGVAPDLNAKIPSAFSSGPLAEESEYWVAWKSFIFTKTEGSVLDKSGKYKSAFVYHTGGNSALREVTIDKVIDLNSDATLNFEVDYKKVFFDAKGVALDVINKSSSHKPGDEPINNFIMDNFVNALSLQ